MYSFDIFSPRPHIANHVQGKGTKRKASRTRAAAQQGAGAQEKSISHLAWRDSTLSMFHALGKLLYNKRQGQQGGPSEEQMRGRKRRVRNRAVLHKIVVRRVPGLQHPYCCTVRTWILTEEGLGGRAASPRACCLSNTPNCSSAS